MSSVQAIREFDGATSMMIGGASGIGRALAVPFVTRDCDVVLADRNGIIDIRFPHLHGSGYVRAPEHTPELSFK